MADKTWKKAERKIAQEFFSSRRRGADTSTDNAGKDTGRIGKSDVFYPGGSIDVKHWKTINYSLLWNTVHQAINYKTDPKEIAIAIIHKSGVPYGESWAGIPIEDFDRLVTNPKFGIQQVRYTIVLTRHGKFYTKDIERAMDQFNDVDESGTVRMAMLQGGYDPVIVVQRLWKFKVWFLDGFTSLT